MSKDMVFYKLFDTMTDDNCPICTLINKKVCQALDSFLYESVNDTSIRKKISQSHGLCNYHSTMLKNMGDPLAHALLYEDLIQDVLHDMSIIKKSALKNFMKHDDCPFCSIAQTCEETYSQAFYSAMSQEEFSSQYKQHGMLCVVHLSTVLSAGEKCSSEKNTNLILELTKAKYTQLTEYLKEIKIKNDYRFIGEEWSPGAKEAWKRAVAVINDTAGLRK